MKQTWFSLKRGQLSNAHYKMLHRIKNKANNYARMCCFTWLDSNNQPNNQSLLTRLVVTGWHPFILPESDNRLREIIIQPWWCPTMSQYNPLLCQRTSPVINTVSSRNARAIHTWQHNGSSILDCKHIHAAVLNTWANHSLTETTMHSLKIASPIIFWQWERNAHNN